MNTFLWRLTLVVACAFAWLDHAAADDAGLYDAPPPPDSAFVRVLNPAVSGGPATVTIEGKEVKVAAASLTPYAVVQSGTVSVEGGKAPATFDAKQGTFYTVVISDGIMKSVFDDAPLSDPAKSRLYFYNMSDAADVDLFVPAAKVTAIKQVEPGAGLSVELKAPLMLDFVAQSGGRELAKFTAVSLKRRGTLSLVVFGTDGNYTGSVIANSVAGAGG